MKTVMSNETNSRIAKTICNMCPTHCGIDVYLENGKIVRVTGMEEHPHHTLCIKAKAIPELVYSSERLTDPLKKVNGTWQKISWDEAFEFIASRLTDIKEKYGPQAVVTHIGEPFVFTYTERMLRRFSELYGTPNYTTGASFCAFSTIIGQSLTCGANIFQHYSSDTRCMMVWGKNPGESFPLEADEIRAMLGRGAKLIVVDPRVTPLAKKADIYAQVRPGTDCALALGLLNVIIAEELYDKAFVDQWTIGFDKLVEQVKQYSPKKVAEITWVPAETIINMARMYVTNKPACISSGVAIDHSTNGVQAIRAITTLVAITGNLDMAGGNVYNTTRLKRASFRLEDKLVNEVSIGLDFPLFKRYTHEVTAVPTLDAILTEKPYPIKALLVVGCNPVLTWANTNKITRAFETLDLLLVVDIFMTDTAKMADVVLPGTTFLERREIREYRNHMVSVAHRIIEPIGNSKEDWEIWAELGRRMGYADYFPWKDSDEIFKYWLEPSQVSLDQLKQSRGGICYQGREFQKYLKNGFNTPSNRVEIYSELMEKSGYAPLPTFSEPAESPVSRPELADQYPLILTTGSRTVAYLHSEYRNLPTLRRLVAEPLIEIHPQTASSLGIADSDLVKVESLRGSVEMKAKLTEDIHPRVVSIQHGWSEANANLLTDDEARDPVSGFPSFKSLLCRVTKAVGCTS
jgi:anaerobic selenocysteine-containing dehydrogenase